MIRRKKKARKKHGIDYSVFAHGKPAVARRPAKRLADAQWALDRVACITYVLTRDVGMCRACHLSGTEVHEEPPRSKGGDPTNPYDAMLLCLTCHGERHRGVGPSRLKIQYADATLRAFGAIVFTRGVVTWQSVPRPPFRPFPERLARHGPPPSAVPSKV